MRGHHQGEITIATTLEKALASVTTTGLLLPTDIGAVALAVTDPRHMHVHSPQGQFVTVRNVKYRLSIHFNLYDGVWSLTRNKESGREEAYLLTLKKVRDDGSPVYDKDDNASDAAKSKAYETVKAKINEWAATADAKAVLAAIAVKKATERVEGARETTKRLRAELAEAENEVRSAEHHLTKTQEAFIDVIAPK